MSSPQPASAASAAAEASAGDPRFAQLLLGAYQWLETNGSSLLADMDYLAQNTRPGGQQPTDKYIALLDVRSLMPEMRMSSAQRLPSRILPRRECRATTFGPKTCQRELMLHMKPDGK